MQVPRFLKLILGADAASCLAMGALLGIGHAPLAELFGLPAGLVLGAGLALIPVGLFILWVATRQSVPALFVWAVILGNIAWVVESMLLVESAPEISAIGTAFVVAQALAVAALTGLETLGAVRSGRPQQARA